MGRKVARENELLRSGGLLSFPRTGCALRASEILPRETIANGSKVAQTRVLTFNGTVVHWYAYERFEDY
jgi:hypothetical protein